MTAVTAEAAPYTGLEEILVLRLSVTYYAPVDIPTVPRIES